MLTSTDNFQGDESEIVIVTLTRSNDKGDIGFMSSPERLNVLLSRARNGLILIGNAETFMSSKKGGLLWKHFIDLLKAKNHTYHGLPVKCEQHPARQAVFHSPEDFDKECPDGGCKELWHGFAIVFGMTWCFFSLLCFSFWLIKPI